VDSSDPLALFAHDAQVKNNRAAGSEIEEPLPNLIGPDGSAGLVAPIQGTIVSISVSVGDEVQRGGQVAVLEAMKMEHVITADRSGIVRAISMSVGDVVREGYPIVFIEEADVEGGIAETHEEVDLDEIRGDLQEVNERRAYIFDENRPEAVARRRKKGQRTPRENIEHLLDEGSFKEFGPLVVAAQRSRRTVEWLRERTPADGLIAGIGSVNGEFFNEERSRVIAVHYDYTVFAGTQGGRGHYKQDRMYELAHRYMLPIILFSEGGGGRPGDTGKEGGPAMIEGGGLGVYTPEEVGPMSFQVPNGVVDILVRDEEAAVETAKKYLSYFQGTVTRWESHDQRIMRRLIPENRVRMYDMRKVIETLADKGMGLIANNPHHLAGAIDSDGADKGSRFLQLCDAFDIPVISLMDCPGIMVGPDHHGLPGNYGRPGP